MALQHSSPEYVGSHTEPESTPYASPICKVRCKSGQSLTIHYDLIRESSGLDKLCGKGKDIRLDDVPYEAVHAIIHFLYTRQWQTIRGGESQYSPAACTLFQTSVHIYAAARKYGISGLVEMAQERVSELAANLCAPDIITLTADASGLLDDDDVWFSAFTDSHLMRFLKESTYSTRTDFLGYFADTTVYSRMLVKGLLRTCCNSVDPVVDCGQPAASACIASPSTDYLQCTPESTQFDVGEMTTASSPRVEKAEPESEVGVTADLEPGANTAPAWDLVNDALDTPAIKEVEEVDVPPEEPEQVTEEGDVDCWAPITKSKKKKKGGMLMESEEPEQVIEEGDVDCWAPITKSKKKKKGGMLMEPEVCMWPDSAPEATAAVECKDDEWGVAARKAKKTKGVLLANIDTFADCDHGSEHIFNGGWEDCSSCCERVRAVSQRYQNMFGPTILTLSPGSSSFDMVKARLHTMANMHLLTLPAELANEISRDLSSDDLLALRLTCRRMRDMASASFQARFFRTRFVMLEKESLSNLVAISHDPTLGEAVQSVELCIDHLIQPQHYISREGLFNLGINDEYDIIRRLDGEPVLEGDDSRESNLHKSLLVEALSNLPNCRRIGLGDHIRPWGAFRLGRRIGTLPNQFVSDLLPNSLIHAVVSIRTLLYAVIKSRLPVEDISIEFGDLMAGCTCVIPKMLLLPRNLEKAVSSQLHTVTTLRLMVNPTPRDNKFECEIPPTDPTSGGTQGWVSEFLRFLGLFTAISDLNLVFMNRDERYQFPELSQLLLVPGLRNLHLGFLDCTISELTAILKRHEATLRMMARQVLQPVVARLEQTCGDDYPTTISAAFDRLGRYEEAERLQLSLLKRTTRLFRTEHPRTLELLVNLATTYQHRGQYTDAERLQLQVLGSREKGRYQEAVEHGADVAETMKVVLGEKHPDTLNCLRNLAVAYHNVQRHQQAEELDFEVVGATREKLGGNYPATLQSMSNPASSYLDTGKVEQAEKLTIELLDLIKMDPGKNHRIAINCMANTSFALLKMGAVDRAESLGKSALDQRQDRLGKDRADTIVSMSKSGHDLQGAVQKGAGGGFDA
ncbi:hypothetical protein CcaCcLH18_10949 [Colletotrichum camelliae]|nr:hypothetical protein CcaCcLH18_10949 [Colletotrichum camelliae]